MFGWRAIHRSSTATTHEQSRECHESGEIHRLAPRAGADHLAPAGDAGPGIPSRRNVARSEGLGWLFCSGVALRRAPFPSIIPWAQAHGLPSRSRSATPKQNSMDNDVIGEDIPTRLLDEGDVLVSQPDGKTAIVMEAR